MRSWVIGMVVLLGASRAAAAEPLVVDPWREPVPPPLVAFEPLSEIIDPWAGATVQALYQTDEIVDPWASYSPRIPTATFPLIE